MGDATSNPWIYMGVIIRAGLEGIRQQLAPPTVVDVEVDDLTPAERDAAGIRTLPSSLPEALQALEDDVVVTGWFDPDLMGTYLAIKREEIAAMSTRNEADICTAYRDIY